MSKKRGKKKEQREKGRRHVLTQQTSSHRCQIQPERELTHDLIQKPTKHGYKNRVQFKIQSCKRLELNQGYQIHSVSEF